MRQDLEMDWRRRPSEVLSAMQCEVCNVVFVAIPEGKVIDLSVDDATSGDGVSVMC